MWCAICNADVAAEVAPDTGQAQCAVCGMRLAKSEAICSRTRDARGILERWARDDLNDSYGGSPSGDPQMVAENSGPASVQRAQASQAPAAQSPSVDEQSHKPAGSRIRIDQPESLGGRQPDTRQRTQRPPRDYQYDPPHASRVPPPHFDFNRKSRSTKTNWSVTAGQWLAYLGVLALTVGTAIVVYGHFSGLSNYTPTGWLVTTVGQMLLFLGVINLVSGGMEQSNDEVSERIELLGQHLVHMEHVAERALRGPHIPASAFGEQGERPLQYEPGTVLADTGRD